MVSGETRGHFYLHSSEIDDLGAARPLQTRVTMTQLLQIQRRLERDRAVQTFLNTLDDAPLELPIRAADLLDGDLYWSNAPLAIIARRVILVLEPDVESLDDATLLEGLRRLRAMGFRMKVRGKAASISALRAGTPRRVSSRPAA